MAEQAPSPVVVRSLKRLGRGIAAPYKKSFGVARWMLISGTILVTLVALAAILAPILAPYGFDQVSSGDERFGNHVEPGADHLLGTSVQGYDVLSRVLWGAQTAVTVVVLSLLFSLAAGVFLGLLAGFVGGWLDRVLVLITDALFAFPYLLLAIVISFLLSGSLGGGITTAALAITVVYVPQYFRIVRSATVSAREATYVEAARALGAPPRTVMFRYLFGNVVHSVPVIATLNAADAILTLAGLGFLGYGVQPNEAAEWGYDLQRAVSDAGSGIWWTGLFPGAAIVLLVMGLTLVGESLNEILNPALRVRRLLPVNMPARGGRTDPGQDVAEERGTP